MSQQTAVFGDGEEWRAQEGLNRARKAWTRWLEGVDWSHWVTLTFGWKTGVARARRDFEQRWIRRLEQTAQNRVDWFAVYERDDYTPLHIHALVRGTDHLERRELRRAWGGLGHATVPEFDATRNGVAYMVKQVGEADVYYDIRENFAGEVPPGEPFGRKELTAAYPNDYLVPFD